MKSQLESNNREIAVNPFELRFPATFTPVAEVGAPGGLSQTRVRSAPLGCYIT